MSKRAAMIRVDQAGEYGATRIYAGQLAVMGDRAPHSGEIRAMAEQEHGHLRAFDALAAQRGVRPTALQPLWSVAGYALDLDTLDRKGLIAIPAVGAHIADKLLEFRQTGRIAALEELHAQLPAGLRALLGIPGLGPKRAHQVYSRRGDQHLATGPAPQIPHKGTPLTFHR